MAKKEFHWDSEEKIGMVEVSDKEKRMISICELNSKQFVAVQKVVLTKGEWKIVANATFPKNVFNSIAVIVNDWATLKGDK